MARTVRERDISSKAKRDGLKPTGKPYWRAIDEGLHVGYRKGLTAGKWVLRRYLGGEQYKVETIGLADDNQKADGCSILSFHQAQTKARELAKRYRPSNGGSELTVRQAVEGYLAGQKGRDQHLRLARHVLPSGLADRPLASLTEPALAAWVGSLPDMLAAATVRRIVTDFKAALNSAWKTHHKDLPGDFQQIVQHGLAIKTPITDVARECQILTDADIRRAIDAAWQVDAQDGWSGDLARLILVLAASGGRFGQVIRITVGDVQGARIMVPVSAKGRGAKSARKTAVPVGSDVITALQPAIVGRKGHETLLLRPHWTSGQARTLIPDSRGPWQWASELNGPWAQIRELAGLDPSIVPYALRHSSIVRGLRAGLPIRLVAQLHDTSTKMIEAHYAAYITDALDEIAARAIVPLTSAPVSHIRKAG
jgi:integrase